MRQSRRTKPTKRPKRIKQTQREMLAPSMAWPKNIWAWSFLLVMFCFACIMHVKTHLAVVQLGYSLSQATSNHRALMAEKRKLMVEVATLKSPRRIRKMAVERLGLAQPDSGQMVQVGKKSSSKLALGSK